MQDAAGVATQQDLLQLRTDVTVAQQRAQRALGEAEAALAQAQRRERDRDTQTEQRVAALAQRVEALTASLTTLSNQLDELNGKLDAVSRQTRAGTPPTTAPRTAQPVPPTATPSTSTTPSTTPAPPDSTTPPTTSTPAPPPVASRPTTNALQPQDIYQAAYLDFSKGSYALAIAGFREFLRRFPDQPLAGAAQYWIGEAHVALARGYANAGQAPQATEALEQAVQEFRKVLANYPRSDKAPASLYKEALALLELKQTDAAQQRLQYLVETFPQSEESVLARERLAALRPN
ncbi:MAG TPA: outer membrane protein assembly factor BamD [Methylomirabilota bacterium]